MAEIDVAGPGAGTIAPPRAQPGETSPRHRADAPQGPTPGPPPAPPPGPRRLPRRAVVALMVLVLASAAGLWMIVARPGAASSELEATGTVEATQAVLGFAAAGRIGEVRVHEGDVAQGGMALAVLDTTVVMARLRQARAQLSLANAQLSDLEQGARPEELEDRRQAVTAAQRTLEEADSDLARVQELQGQSVVSRQALDQARTARDVAAARYEQARQALSLTEAGARSEQIAAARAAREAAFSAVDLMQATVPDYVIRSPFDGLVTIRAHEPGESVTPGSPVVAVLNRNDRWVRIYVPENRAVGIGWHATITADAFPDRRFAGDVTWISPEAEFTPRNVQTKDERVKLVYAVKVRITDDSAMALKPGMPADVRIAPSR